MHPPIRRYPAADCAIDLRSGDESSLTKQTDRAYRPQGWLCSDVQSWKKPGLRWNWRTTGAFISGPM